LQELPIHATAVSVVGAVVAIIVFDDDDDGAEIVDHSMVKSLFTDGPNICLYIQ